MTEVGERTPASAPSDGTDVPAGVGEDGARTGHPPGRRLVRRVLAGLLVLALLAVAVISTMRLRSSADQEADRDAVLSAARGAAVAFTSYDHRSLDASFERLLALSTDNFREQFTAASEQLRPLIAEKKAQAKGEVLAAALESSDGADRAVVFVAADATVTNTDVPKGALQRFRLRLSLKRVDGQWRVDEITPVV